MKGKNRLTNAKLRKASKNKKNEFYTSLDDIKKELYYYSHYFKDKIIYCNCDDPYRSNFVKYFTDNFDNLGIKQIVSTCYVPLDIDMSQFSKCVAHPVIYIYDGNTKIIKDLNGDGDFRSDECIKILMGCDIVVTNPPFSLFREFIDVVIEHNKDFIVIGNQNAITYKNVFNLLKDGTIKLGYNTNKTMSFNVPDEYYACSKNQSHIKEVKVPAISWFTSLNNNREHEYINLKSKYSKDKYPKYDNYDAINVDRVADIPCDYYGFMGVPITFMNKHNPKQFDVLGIMNTGEKNEGIRLPNTSHGRPIVNGVEKYLRVIIKRKM